MGTHTGFAYVPECIGRMRPLWVQRTRYHEQGVFHSNAPSPCKPKGDPRLHLGRVLRGTHATTREQGMLLCICFRDNSAGPVGIMRPTGISQNKKKNSALSHHWAAQLRFLGTCQFIQLREQYFQRSAEWDNPMSRETTPINPNTRTSLR